MQSTVVMSDKLEGTRANFVDHLIKPINQFMHEAQLKMGVQQAFVNITVSTKHTKDLENEEAGSDRETSMMSRGIMFGWPAQYNAGHTGATIIWGHSL